MIHGTTHDNNHRDHVSLRWITPNAETEVVDIARVSNIHAIPEGGTPSSRAVSLLRRCIRRAEWSPFDMACACLEFRTTRDIGRQVLRHWSFRFQEFSQRYADVTSLGSVDVRETRMQDHTNRQSSLPTTDSELKRLWESKQRDVISKAAETYAWALSHGIAKEQARVVLPEGLTPTRMYVQGTLRSWMHYCGLRRGNGTQYEHQILAREAFEILWQHIPIILQAYDEENS